jgi:glycosyltransferase involved in cell wall biosynthesis
VKVVMLLGRSTGGIGTHVAQLSTDLRRRGVEVVVVTHPLTAGHFDLAPVRLWWPGSSGPAQAARDLRRLRHLVGSADIVHAHGHQGALLGSVVTANGPRRRALGLAARGLRVPAFRAPKLIVSHHNAVLAGSGRQGLKRAAQRWVARRADLVTGASSDLVQEVLRFGAARARLAKVPSPRVPDLLAQRPADAPERARLRRTLFSSLGHDLDQAGMDHAGIDHVDLDQAGMDDADLDHVDLDHAGMDHAVPLVVTISRIAPQKNLQVLVEAASRLSQPCTWVVVGDGEPVLLAELRQQASAAGAPVHFVGASTEIGRWLRAAEVFVLPSQWEARALVVQEAMAAGTPVVASDVGGLHDLVAGSGLLVPAGDPEAVAKATDSVLADPALREELAAAGRQTAQDLPDGSDTAAQWLAWYLETLLMT